MQLALVKATQADAPEHLRIWQAVWGRSSRPHRDLSAAEQDIAFRSVFLITLDGESAGLVSFEHRSSERIYLVELAMLPQFQGRGAGGAVLDILLHAWAGQGYTHVDLVTHPDNPAQRLYRRKGFKEICSVSNWKGNGPRVMMSARLKMTLLQKDRALDDVIQAATPGLGPLHHR